MDSSTGRYARLQHALLGHPKWQASTLEERGAFVSLLLYADMTYPQPLHRDGLAVFLGVSPNGVVDRLIDRGWLDDLGDGRLAVHDLAAFHVRPSDTSEARAERQRQSRMSRMSRESQ